MTAGSWFILALCILQTGAAIFTAWDGRIVMGAIYAFYSLSNVGFLFLSLGYK